MKNPDAFAVQRGRRRGPFLRHLTRVGSLRPAWRLCRPVTASELPRPNRSIASSRLFICGATRQGVPAEVNVLATLLLAVLTLMGVNVLAQPALARRDAVRTA
jgi:hypothetical protein